MASVSPLVPELAADTLDVCRQRETYYLEQIARLTRRVEDLIEREAYLRGKVRLKDEEITDLIARLNTIRTIAR